PPLRCYQSGSTATSPAIALQRMATTPLTSCLTPGVHFRGLGGGGGGGGFGGGAFNARATDEGRTFLSNKGGETLLGEKLFPDFITLRSNPFDPRQPSAPWSSDLLPNRAMTWVEKG